MPGFLIAAAHKSSGKTVITTGLAAAFRERGKSVQCFKKGPDYIDPMWLTAGSGRACYNLDFNTMDSPEISDLFAARSAGHDISIIEANKGLYDGVDPAGLDSNAALAKLLDVPVVLVIDTVGMTRGIAPLLLGYGMFDRDVKIAGVILNKVGGTRHEEKLRRAVGEYCDIPVIGAIWRHPELDIGERHLGLTTPAENGRLHQMIRGFASVVAGSVDLDQLAEMATPAGVTPVSAPVQPAPDPPDLRIAIARDAAFGFYYPDDLAAFAIAGAELVEIDMTRDHELPQVDGLFIGGGFPEVQMRALSQNLALRQDVRSAIENGLPTYAECGGLMYLCQNLQWRGETLPMAGAIKGDAVMCDRPQGRGYTVYEPTATAPWGGRSSPLRAHEFHYSRIDGLPADTRYAHNTLRGHGIDGKHDGIVTSNLVAGFGHLRNTNANPWVREFVDFVRKCRKNRTGPRPAS